MEITSKLPALGTTIFTVMSDLAAKHNAINLSQGFPDFECSPELTELVNKYMRIGKNQYAPMAGVAELRARISEKQNLLHKSYYDPGSEITITAGGTQAIYTALTAVVRQGDEVIIFEPAYDSYAPSIELLGGKVIGVELLPPHYGIDWDVVRGLISEKTRMIILNSPNNPTGTVLAGSDLAALANLTRNTDILILSDEVYEHLVYDYEKHLSLSSHEELKYRTFVCASFGKLFHTTGWKIGYCLAPEKLMAEFRKVHQFMVFSVNTPVQYALAEYLKESSLYTELGNFFQLKRDTFRGLMRNTRFELLPCSGSYFQLASYSRISDEPDREFAKRLTIKQGVATIPVSAFYRQSNDHRVLRFCFAKKQETLEKAVERLVNV